MKPFTLLLAAFFALTLPAAARAEEIPAAAPESAPGPSVTEIEDGTITRLELLHAEAAKLLEEQKPREAIAVYTDILLIEPDDDAAYTNMGQAYLMVGDAGRAKEAFLNALHIDRDNEIAVEALRSIADPDGTLASGTLRDGESSETPETASPEQAIPPQDQATQE